MLFALLQGLVSAAYPIPLRGDSMVRMLNRSKGYAGAFSKFKGYVGYAVFCNTTEDFKKEMETPRKRPEVFVLPISAATNETLLYLNNSYSPKQYMQGIVVLPNHIVTSGPSPPISHHYQIPDYKFDYPEFKDGYVWNPNGQAVFDWKFMFPIVVPAEDPARELYTSILTYGNRVGVSLSSFERARDSAAFCFEKSTCDPVGGLSMIGTFRGGFDANQQDKPEVWAITSYDTYSFVPYSSTGADYSISGFVAQLAALESLKNVNWDNAPRRLKFAFFDAEEIGNSGSRAFVNDMLHFKCTVPDGGMCRQPWRSSLDFQSWKFSNIKQIIEVRSVGLPKDNGTLFAHSHRTTGSRALIDNLLNLNYRLPLKVSEPSNPNSKLPPSSTKAFLHEAPDLPHVVLAAFDDRFHNGNVGTIADSAYDLDYLTSAATSLGRIYAAQCGVDDAEVAQIEADRYLVQQIMDAYIGIPDQSALLHEFFPTRKLPTDHDSIYTHTYHYYSMEMKQMIVAQALKDAVADQITTKTCTHDQNCTGDSMYCSRVKRYVNITYPDTRTETIYSQVCERAVMRPHAAISLGMERNDATGKWYITDDNEIDVVVAEGVSDASDLKIVLLPDLFVGRILTGLAVAAWVGLAFLGAMWWNLNVRSLIK